MPMAEGIVGPHKPIKKSLVLNKSSFEASSSGFHSNSSSQNGHSNNPKMPSSNSILSTQCGH
ncbi:MAG: hypothetical protein CBC92_000235 [Euryarchaeota archaeon TMED132]|nr:hypothetical protein [Euryarchaeota archaeon]RAH08180.1 MAG: hypothetical protein CBC92_000235 [Euryarchaeota archaeon TMED132]|tara:strand:- start:132 stop:317 length:186 start_codon:yes stop_codon:yes gene_type:complete